MKRQIILIGLSLNALILIFSTAYAQSDQDPVHIKTGSLNVRENSLHWVEILGEVINESSSVVGFVEVSITVKDASGKVIDTGSAYAKGKTVSVNGVSSDNGIFPGETATFSTTFTDITLADAKDIQYIVTYRIAEPRSDFPDAPILTRLAQIDSSLASLKANSQSTNPTDLSLMQQNRTSIDSLSTIIKNLNLNTLKAQVDSLLKQSSGNTSTSSLIGDLDSDGDVDFQDFIIFAQAFGTKA